MIGDRDKEKALCMDTTLIFILTLAGYCLAHQTVVAVASVGQGYLGHFFFSSTSKTFQHLR